jgi:membrane-bound lytic murein transglycosylase D
LWQRIRTGLTWQKLGNERVATQRRALLRQNNYLPNIAERADYYLYYIVEEVSARDMPMEIALIPVIESTLDPFASSYAGAAGLWQIMPRTGKRLGLEQDAWYDGRQALRDSTEGALDYLQFLHDKFDGDWLLAVAAYNAGEGTISEALSANAARGRDTDYWSLKLRRQARDYVPKIIALAQVVATPERYGVEIPHVANSPAFEIADTGSPLRFSQAAELAGVDVATLHALNPGQLRGALSPNRDAEMLLPVGTRDQFEAGLERLDTEELTPWQTYRVRPGDTLWQLARRFDTDVALLAEVNDLQGSLIRAGDSLQIPVSAALDAGQPQTLGANGARAKGYLVRAGDSLYRIASKFKVSVSNIIAWNGLDPAAYLQPGQKLTLYIGDG